MTNDDTSSRAGRPKRQFGELSIGSLSHEKVVDLAELFQDTEEFLNTIEYILKRADVVFGIQADRPFLEPPPQKNAIAAITRAITAVHLAWQVASDCNTDIASFKGDTLLALRKEIYRVDRYTTDAARSSTGYVHQQGMTEFRIRLDITNAFFGLNRQLGILRAKCDLAGRSPKRKSHGNPYLGLIFLNDQTVRRMGYEANLPIEVAPQCLRLLKFVHEAGARGRTQSEIVPAIIQTTKILTSEKNRLKEDLKIIDLDLGARGQYVVRCTKPTS